MTLLVAGIIGARAWMVADTAITGPIMPTRSREYTMKIEPIQQAALVGFAGDPRIAAMTIRAAASQAQGMETVDFFLREHQHQTQVDFMYAYFDDEVPHLFRVSNGLAEETNASYIGKPAAFSQFQEIKHAHSLEFAPDALTTFLAGAVDDSNQLSEPENPVFKNVGDAILAMQKLFYRTSKREVGGTPIPYILSPYGARVYGYGYSMTDPGLNALKPGSIISHGTAQAGGYGVSVTELRERDGIVVYWLQRPGGHVWLKSGDWYDKYEFLGTPTAFKEAVKETLGRDIDIWFGDQPQGAPEAIRVIRDSVGRPRLTVAQTGQSISFAWIQGSEDPFACSSSISLTDMTSMIRKNDTFKPPVNVKCSDDKLSAVMSLDLDREKNDEISLSAEQLDQIIEQLGLIRSQISTPIKSELEDGTELKSIFNPAWRTRPVLHPGLPGRLLVLRHPGLGWLAFILPPYEAASLSACLGADTES